MCQGLKTPHSSVSPTVGVAYSVARLSARSPVRAWTGMALSYSKPNSANQPAAVLPGFALFFRNPPASAGMKGVCHHCPGMALLLNPTRAVPARVPPGSGLADRQNSSSSAAGSLTCIQSVSHTFAGIFTVWCDVRINISNQDWHKRTCVQQV